MKLCLSAESPRVISACVLIFSCFILTGCGQPLSSEDQIRRFEQAGPIAPQVDVDTLLKAKIHTGYYRVVPGDLLSLEMPAFLRVMSADISQYLNRTANQSSEQQFTYRVNTDGTITLPIIGKMPVAGKKLIEIETLIVQAFYPKYVKTLPSVVCMVKEYQIQNVTVVGGVGTPGIHELNSNEMSLVTALMKSGGITERGAGVITIRHRGNSDANILPDGTLADPNVVLRSSETDVETAKQETLALPVKDMYMPFVDVPLQDGDVVEVERLNPEVFTVLGLAMQAGVYPYPPEVEYSLANTLAFAGGPDLTLGARYVTIYRADADGEIVFARFGIGKKDMIKAMHIKIKPGDVISIDETLSTSIRRIMRDMMFFRVGYNLDLADDRN